MRSCSAAYVDVGYLLAAAATRVTGSSLRRGVQTDYADLITALIAQIEADSGLPLLRVNWYDAGSRPGGMPDAVQDEIGALPRVKLRLGRLSYSGEQKGVDVRIGLDLAIQAQHRVADVAYLVSGDDDLTEAVEEAQGRGVQVVVLAVAGHDGRPLAVSKHLTRAADRVVLIDPETIDRTVKSLAIPEGLLSTLAPDADTTLRDAAEADTTLRDAAGPAPELGEAAGGAAGTGAPGAASPGETEKGRRTRRRTRGQAAAEAAAGEATVAPDGATGSSGGHQVADDGDAGHGTQGKPDGGAPAPPPPSPALLARRKPTELVLPGTTPSTPSVATPVGPASDLVDRSQQGAPVELTAEVIDDVAKRVVAAWCSSASPQALIELREHGPTIPAELDRALLVDLAGRAGGEDPDDVERHAVRARFWYHIARVRMA